MRRLPKIDKKSADPELLRQYEDMRNERRTQGLYIALPIVGGFCTLSVLALVFLQPSAMVAAAISLVGIMLIFGLLILMAGLSPHGRRLIVLTIVVGLFGFLALAAWFIDWLLGQIFN